MFKNASCSKQKFKNLRHELHNVRIELADKPKSNKKEYIKICLPGVLSTEMITPHLNTYLMSHPNIELSICYRMGTPTEDFHYFDVIMADFNEELPKGFEIYSQTTETAYIFCAPSYAEKYGTPQMIEELEQHNVIGWMPHDYTEETPKYIKIVHKRTKETFLFNNEKTAIKMNLSIQMRALGLAGEHIFAARNLECMKDVYEGKLLNILPDYCLDVISFKIMVKSEISGAINHLLFFLRGCLERSQAPQTLFILEDL